MRDMVRELNLESKRELDAKDVEIQYWKEQMDKLKGDFSRLHNTPQTLMEDKKVGTSSSSKPKKRASSSSSSSKPKKREVRRLSLESKRVIDIVRKDVEIRNLQMQMDTLKRDLCGIVQASY